MESPSIYRRRRGAKLLLSEAEEDALMDAHESEEGVPVTSIAERFKVSVSSYYVILKRVQARRKRKEAESGSVGT